MANGNPMIGYGVVGGIFFVALMVALVGLSGDDDTGRGVIEMEWYYDLNTKKRFAKLPGLHAPILAPSQAEGDTPMGVRLVMVSCGDCEKAEKAWLEKFTDEAIEALQQARDDLSINMDKGRLLRKVDGGEWVDVKSREGLAITRAFYNKCPKGENGNSTYRECFPPKED